MITVTQLARRCGLSRSTVLYYESVRVLSPRCGLRRIPCVWRERRGAPRADCVSAMQAWARDIRAILDRPESDASGILKRRLVELNAEIQALRGHQRAILKLLQHKFLSGGRK